MKIDLAFDARAVRLQLDRIPQQIIAPAAVRALNRTLTSARSASVKKVRTALPLSAKSIRGRLALERATRSKLVAAIVAKRDYDPGLYLFAPKWRQKQPGGATIKMPGRPRQIVSGAFVARTSYGRDAVFRRIGRSRRPIKFLRASDVGLPTIASAFLQAVADGAFQRLTRDTFRRNFAAELKFRAS